MRSVIFIFTFFISSITFANTIITDTSRLDELYNKVRKNNYFLKVGPIKYKIYSFEIGYPQTPFYEKSNLTKRFYKYENKCFELTVYETLNIARKVNCFDKLSELQLPGKSDFKVTTIAELLKEGHKSFRLGEFYESYEMEAFLQSYDLFTFDQQILGERVMERAPRRKFKTHLNGYNEVILNEKNLELKQVLKLEVDRIGLMAEKTKETKKTTKLRPDGVLLSNGQGQVIIYNPYTQVPFGDYELTLNPQVPQLLNQMAQDSLSAPVCFPDNYINPKPKDCHKLIFKSHDLGIFTEIKMVLVDFFQQRVEFIK